MLKQVPDTAGNGEVRSVSTEEDSWNALKADRSDAKDDANTDSMGSWYNSYGTGDSSDDSDIYGDDLYDYDDDDDYEYEDNEDYSVDYILILTVRAGMKGVFHWRILTMSMN